MTAQILDGRALSQQILNDLKRRIAKRSSDGLAPPGLAVILVGADPASQIYVNKKCKTCEEIGIQSFKHVFDTITEEALLALINRLNNDNSVHGVLVQLPLPTIISTRKIIEAIHPNKDVDGFHPYNLGRLMQRRPLLRPCTPFGVIKLLMSIEGFDPIGKHAVIVGASNIVGRPLVMELLLIGCTVSICHRHTRNLAHMVSEADIVIAAAGKPGLIQGEWIKPGAIVIDVGINRLASGQLVGDVEFDTAKKRASWITPVPGGVGPMTVAMLMANTLTAAGA